MTTIASGNAALDSILQRLPENLQAHAGRARDQALWMAEAHGIDPERAGLAALAHDIARAMPEAELLERAAAYGIEVHPVEERMAVLLHGQVGSEILRRECGIDDPEVLEAVWWHTTFNRGLGPIAAIAFLADKLDPAKADRYPYRDRIVRLAGEDLGAAALAFIHEELVAALNDGRQIHPAYIEARNELLASGGGS